VSTTRAPQTEGSGVYVAEVEKKVRCRVELFATDRSDARERIKRGDGTFIWTFEEEIPNSRTIQSVRRRKDEHPQEG
jgi:hypothetical protein